MNTYYLDQRSENDSGAKDKKVKRLFVIMDDTYYWAAEWYGKEGTMRISITDINGGFVSEDVRAACSGLEKISADVLRKKFGLFAEYIERAVNGYRSYLLWISPDPEVQSIDWENRVVKDTDAH